ncbi:hypothetical protein FSP39_001327 [Pinctada imbricata]|uniref:Hemimethylated DNA-binding domain-containing protein n=1 Tax=Pinctada imbricata TaxID=66713 RepID=A0AA88Y8D7_PINIB|nr:hypothetical protein FSP39_001327 [Pinctada imbricata]
MPVDRRAAIQLGLLILAVPTQYIVTRLLNTSETQRTFAISKLLNNAAGFKEKYLSWNAWHKWCVDIINNIKSTSHFSENEDLYGESPAVEVLNFKDPEGYFAGSADPRSPRPPEVKYRVGQVIRHKIWGYRGVIIGWDPQARAPERWIKEMHRPDKPQWRHMPNYSILVDIRDRMTPQQTYVPEENIEIISNVKIMHPGLDNYFEGFDGAQYLPRPWLKTVYPHD